MTPALAKPLSMRRAYDTLEIVADATVHVVGIVVALAAGAFLLVQVALAQSVEHLPALVLYVASLVGVLSVSLAFNMWPVTAIKHYLARVDQAAIFLFIAGTYTPFLAVMNGARAATMMMVIVWSLALIGIALKLLVPERFGRVAVLLYLAIGWSGLLVFQNLSASISPTALVLLLAGGLTYSFGIIFHLWEKLRFHNALWHLAVVIGATLHLGAVFETLVMTR
jgi:hemolysin III